MKIDFLDVEGMTNTLSWWKPNKDTVHLVILLACNYITILSTTEWHVVKYTYIIMNYVATVVNLHVYLSSAQNDTWLWS